MNLSDKNHGNEIACKKKDKKLIDFTEKWKEKIEFHGKFATCSLEHTFYKVPLGCSDDQIAYLFRN